MSRQTTGPAPALLEDFQKIFARGAVGPFRPLPPRPLSQNVRLMRLTPRRFLAVVAALVAPVPLTALASTAEMTAAAQKLLAALDPAQRATAVIARTAP
ncbi:MAG: hypothetical protein CFE26_27825, partial [Verrucomicrobiales bacterium VVV1]